MAADGADDASWTVGNVDTKSTFELRHWLVRNAGLGTEQEEFEKNFEAKFGRCLHPNFLHAAVCTIRERDETARVAKEAEVKRKEESGEVETLQQRCVPAPRPCPHRVWCQPTYALFTHSLTHSHMPALLAVRAVMPTRHDMCCRLARQKAERKAAAIARSQERQRGAEYFARVKAENDQGKEQIEAAKQRAKAATAEEAEAHGGEAGGDGGAGDGAVDRPAEVDEDPFALGKRLKIRSN